MNSPSARHASSQRPGSFRSTWFAPLCAFVLISAISIASYLAQTLLAEKSEKNKAEEIQTQAVSSLRNAYEKLDDVGTKASSLYNENDSTFEQSITQFVEQNDLGSRFKGATFIGYLPDKKTPSDSRFSFVESGMNVFQETNATEIVNIPVSDLVNIDDEVTESARSGEMTISEPFTSDVLTDSSSTYTLLIFPVYSIFSVTPSEEQRIATHKGSLVIPVDLDVFLSSALESSTSFRLFRYIQGDRILASSNKSVDETNLHLNQTAFTTNNVSYSLEYDNYAYNAPQLASSRRTTLFTGLGLAAIVFLLFAMMRVNERRSKRLAQKAEQDIHESEARFSALIEQSSDITLVLDGKGTINFVSPSVTTILGFPHEDLLGANIGDFLGMDSTRRKTIDVLDRLNKGEKVGAFEAEVLSQSGVVTPFECVVNDLRNDPAVRGIVLNSRDISDRKQAQIQILKTRALYENALSNAPIGIALVHQDGKCFYSNEALQDFLGRSEDDVKSMRLRDFITEDDAFSFSDMWQTLEVRSQDRISKELRFDHPDGRIRWGHIHAQGVYDDEVFQYYVVQIEDTTERRSIAERLEYQAIHDPLTGLPNRLLFVDRLEVSLMRAKRTGLAVAVLFLDLDRFKVVNDSLGHAAGDRLLETVADRIKASVRPNDTIARFGGDEFVILCEDISDEKQTDEISERLLKNINRPIMLLEGEVYVTASIGIAQSLNGEDTPETILRDADTAMYRAKDGGRNRSEVFDARTHARAVANLETGNGMFRALEQNEFRMHYQPIISLSSGKLAGFEALVYWQHPERGHISPNEFIPLAEETGVIVPLGLRIFEESCRQLHKWHQLSPAASTLTISINLSPRQLAEPTFVHEVEKILQRTGVNPSRVWCEITETALMGDADSTISMLDQLRTLGIHFEVDDFGTGFSSLSYLKKFPVDALKVDQSFVDGLGRDPEDTAIVTAVVSLAHALGLHAIAEGVETPLQMAELKTLGCEYAQGYLYARAAAPEIWNSTIEKGGTFTFSETPL